MNPASTRSRRSFVFASWVGQFAGVVAGVLMPSLLAPHDYALVFQLRQIHLLGYFTFAFVLQAAVLELGFARGRETPERETDLQHVSLASVLLFSTISALLCVFGILVFAGSVTPETRVGVVSFAAMLPLIGVTGWANRVLMAAQRFDLLWRHVLAHMVGISGAGLVGAYLFGFAGVLGGVGAGNLCAAVYGLLLCRGIGAVGLHFAWPLLRELSVVGIPQSFVALIAVASRILDRNFAYLGYGEDLGGVFAVAATFALNTITLTAAMAETARPTINEECAVDGQRSRGPHFVEFTLSGFVVAVAVAVLAFFCMRPLYGILFADYARTFPRAVPLALAAICAAGPATLAFHAQMYLVATKRARLYVAPPLFALTVMIAGNALGIRMQWGLFGVVAVGAASNVVLALVSLQLTGWYYPGLRARCVGVLTAAVAIAGGAALGTRLLLGFARGLATRLGTAPDWTTFGVGIVLGTCGGVAFVVWRRTLSVAPPSVESPPTSIDNEPVAIIIPCHDRPALLRACLSALHGQRDAGPFDIVVVDSSGGTEIAPAVADFPDVRRVASPTHLDAGEARNLGVRETSHPIIAFVDADCMPDPHWIRRMREALAAGARITGGAILDVRSWSPAAAAAHFMQCTDAGPQRPGTPVPHLPGCNLAMRRETFAELGAFTPGRGEDIRLTEAATARWPGSVWFTPAMHVRHSSSPSLRALWRRSRELGFDRGYVGPAPRLAMRLGHSRPAAVCIAAVRFAYLAVRTIQWNPRATMRFILFAPFVLFGLMGWAMGLADGLKASERN